MLAAAVPWTPASGCEPVVAWPGTMTLGGWPNRCRKVTVRGFTTLSKKKDKVAQTIGSGPDRPLLVTLGVAPGAAPQTRCRFG